MQVSSGPSFPITNYLAPVSASVSPSAVSSANGTVLKSTGSGPVSSGGLMQLPTSFTLMPGELRGAGRGWFSLGQIEAIRVTLGLAPGGPLSLLREGGHGLESKRILLCPVSPCWWGRQFELFSLVWSG